MGVLGSLLSFNLGLAAVAYCGIWLSASFMFSLRVPWTFSPSPSHDSLRYLVRGAAHRGAEGSARSGGVCRQTYYTHIEEAFRQFLERPTKGRWSVIDGSWITRRCSPAFLRGRSPPRGPPCAGWH